MIELITYQNTSYPKFQSIGNSAQFATPFAKHVCSGVGYDIGCGEKEWVFNDSIPIDPKIDPNWHANKLPYEKYGLVDYIFSSHCLEHLDSWVKTLEYWIENLKQGGVLFLYLPDYSQVYWRPWNNRKHLSVFTPQIMKDCFETLNLSKVFCSGVDLNNSFIIMGEKNGSK